MCVKEVKRETEERLADNHKPTIKEIHISTFHSAVVQSVFFSCCSDHIALPEADCIEAKQISLHHVK